MIKVIDLSSYDDYDISLIDAGASASASLTKSAATRDDIREFVESLEVKPGKFYIHINAMTAGEYYGANRNADYFSEEQLKKWHHTFTTTPAKLFRNHRNKPDSPSFGVVIFSTYNDTMHRVELIVEADRSVAQDIEDDLMSGSSVATSMACKTPYDECSICGNKARSRAEYCSHLATELGRVYPDGRKVMALNSAPLKFFDISRVVKPADVTSYVLQKVASVGGATGGAELAEDYGLLDKEADFKKISELIKEIEGDAFYALKNHSVANMISNLPDPTPEDAELFSQFPVKEVGDAFAYNGISPSLSFLADMIAHKVLKEDYIPHAGKVALSLLLSVKDELHSEVPLNFESPSITTENASLQSYIGRKYPDSALTEDNLMKVASNIGYYNPSGKITSEFDTTLWPEKPQAEKTNFVLKLLLIGAAALGIKKYIGHVIDEKMAKNPAFSQDSAKIVLVKRASFEQVVKLASELANVSTAQDLKAVEDENKDNPQNPILGEAAKDGLYAGRKLVSFTGVKETKIGKGLSAGLSILYYGAKE